jgi:uncharacterized membrane protein
MRTRGQTGNAVIWGAGALLLAFGMYFLLRYNRDNQLGLVELALLEGFIGTVLVVFGIVSFYMAHK